jgi:hypothetical protein
MMKRRTWSGKMPRVAMRSDLVFGGRADVRSSVDASGELYR